MARLKSKPKPRGTRELIIGALREHGTLPRSALQALLRYRTDAKQVLRELLVSGVVQHTLDTTVKPGPRARLYELTKQRRTR